MSGKGFTRITKPASPTPTRQTTEPVQTQPRWMREPFRARPGQPLPYYVDISSPGLAGVQAKPSVGEAEAMPQERPDNATAYAPPVSDRPAPPPEPRDEDRFFANIPLFHPSQAENKAALPPGSGGDWPGYVVTPARPRPLGGIMRSPQVQRRIEGEEEAAVQAMLKVGKPNDKYEQEAERVADTIMKMPQGLAQKHAESFGLKREGLTQNKFSHIETVQREASADGTLELETREVNPKKEITEEDVLRVKRIICPECDDAMLQTKLVSGRASRVYPDLESRIHRTKEGGQPLPDGVRQFFETRFGYNFGGVKVHTDADSAETANRLNAKAYTTGSDIVFSSGQYNPQSLEGRRLLAHELTHVVQQTQPTRPSTVISQHSDNVLQRSEVTATEEAMASRTLQQVRIREYTSQDHLQRYTKEYCDDMYELCCDGCRRLPNRTKADKARRALCWSLCMSQYAACLASSEEALIGVLTVAAIVAAIVLAAADGPFPIGDAAAVALLIALGIL